MPHAYSSKMDRQLNWKRAALLGCVLLGPLLAVPYLAGALYIPPPPSPPAPAADQPRQFVERAEIRAGDSMYSVLERAGIDEATRIDVIHAFNDVYDMRKVRADRDLVLTRWEQTGELAALTYMIDPDHKLLLSRIEGVSFAEVAEIPGTVKEVAVCATLQDSLAATMDRAGESFLLAMMMAEVLAFDIDFYRDPQFGDDFCLLVEKKVYDNGQPSTYRRILGARYNNHGSVSEAYYFGDSYYGPKGESLKSAFLRSPLEFDARISSHFSMNRRHPVLHTVRAHYGTDYAAPTGTPVRAVADGTVVGAGASGGSGNMVTIRHADGYQTQYLHLSRILVRSGQKVGQGSKIGLVGMTGLATGPHLDLRISRNGKYMNWERFRPQRTVSLEGTRKEAFHVEHNRMRSFMDEAKNPALASR